MGKDCWGEGKEKKTEAIYGGRSQNAGLVIIITIGLIFQFLHREASLHPLHWNHKKTTNAHNNQSFP